MTHPTHHRTPRLSTGELLALAGAFALLVATLVVGLWGLLAPVDPYPIQVVRIPTSETVHHDQWPWPGGGPFAPNFTLWVETPRPTINIPDLGHVVIVG